MKNPFSEIAKGFEWLGRKTVAVAAWLPRAFKIVRDAEGDTVVVLPELVTLVEDVDAMAVAAIKDGAADLTALETLTEELAIEGADLASGNFVGAAGSSPAVVAAGDALIKQITNSASWSDLLAAIKKTVTDYDVLGATVEADIKTLESDADSA